MNKKEKIILTNPDEAAKMVVDRFGYEILADHRRFCAAFSDFAPKLSKECKAYLVALSENAGEIYLNAQKDVAEGNTAPDEVNRRAFAIISEFLNTEKAEMVVSGLSFAMGWGKTESRSKPQMTITDEPLDTSQFTSDDLFRKAEDGDVNAQFNLAERFYYGRGVKHSYPLAVHWFKAAAQAGLSSAQRCLGDCYHNGQGIPKDFSIAVIWYEKAAQQGDYEAQQALIRCYKTGGFNLTQDIARAHQLMREYGISGDYANSLALLQKSAENGCSHSQLKLADTMFYGNNTDCDRTGAFQWYMRAAEQNNPEAQFSLARCYAEGEGTEKNSSEAFYWYEKAAENGHAEAMNNLGCCFFNGTGAAIHYKKAAELFLKAANLGSVRAQYNYGECCYQGAGVIKNLSEAAKWYKMAAVHGNAEAQYSLGWCYYFGEGISQDYSSAKHFFKLSAQQRNPNGQIMLGYCCLNGQGTEKNYAKAAEWFEKAANRGSSEAAQMLVKCLATGGFFLARDTDKAKRTAEKYGVKYETL